MEVEEHDVIVYPCEGKLDARIVASYVAGAHLHSKQFRFSFSAGELNKISAIPEDEDEGKDLVAPPHKCSQTAQTYNPAHLVARLAAQVPKVEWQFKGKTAQHRSYHSRTHSIDFTNDPATMKRINSAHETEESMRGPQEVPPVSMRGPQEVPPV